MRQTRWPRDNYGAPLKSRVLGSRVWAACVQSGLNRKTTNLSTLRFSVLHFHSLSLFFGHKTLHKGKKNVKITVGKSIKKKKNILQSITLLPRPQLLERLIAPSTGWILITILWIRSLLRSRFLDVTQRFPLRDIQKTAAKETTTYVD